MDTKILDRYLKIKVRMEGTDNSAEAAACAKRMATLEQEYPGIAAEARKRALEQRLRERAGLEEPEPEPVRAKGRKGRKGRKAPTAEPVKRPLEGVIDSMLGLLGRSVEDIESLDRFLEYLADNEEIGRAVLGADLEGEVEPDEDLIDFLEDRVIFDRVDVGKLRTGRKGSRRDSIRITFTLPRSVWEQEIASPDDDGEIISTTGAVSFIALLCDVIADAREALRDDGDDHP